MNAIPFSHRLFLSLILAAGLFSLGSTCAFAQAAGARGENFLYRTMPGDTLIALAQRYTGDSANWTRLQTLNQVRNPALLPIGLEIKIPFALIPELPSTASVSHQAGQARIDGQALEPSSRVAEGDTVVTGADGYVTLQLSDGSLLTVPASSSLKIERLRVFKGTGLVDVIIHMSNGTLESHVAPKETGVGRFEVRTPASITGVRGTRLRVHASAHDGTQSAVLKGRAQVRSAQAQEALLRRDQGTAVNAQGRLLGVRPLLPAPRLPTPIRAGGGIWSLDFPPVSGATRYLVRVSSDQAGADLVSSRNFSKPRITFSAPGAGNYYVSVRAIDDLGIGGKDATRPFLGRSVLTGSNGAPVLSGSGRPIMLIEY